MQIFDAHLDMAWNATDWNRDLNKPIAEIRAFENQFQLPGIVDGDTTVSWPELHRDGVCTIIATLLASVEPPRSSALHCGIRSDLDGGFGKEHFRRHPQHHVRQLVPDLYECITLE